MHKNEIKDGFYWIGVRDPHLKVFDIIMKTEFGTTYNSYLIKGEKNILVETAKVGFYDDYVAKIEGLIGNGSIDYIIVNHTEPDHSGSIKNLLSKYPKAQVICSRPAQLYLKNMLNEDFSCKTVTDGEELELGGKKFKFLIAPFLHWPDTMFTYYIDENVLFTCDFFGCHYCMEEGKIYDHETGDFSQAFRYYFDVIMGPFKEHVLKATPRVRELNAEMFCTSHGPILTGDLNRYIEKYEDWSKDVQIKRDRKYVLIAYVSAYGFTRTIAEGLYDAIKGDERLDVELIDISDHELEDIKFRIEHADGIMLGSPTFNQDALKPVWDVLSVVSPINVKNKLAAAFGSFGWSGEAVKMLEDRMRSLKFKVVESELRISFAPSDADLEKAAKFARCFVEKL